MVHVTVTGGVKTRQFNLSVYIVLVNGLSIVGIVLGVMNAFSVARKYNFVTFRDAAIQNSPFLTSY